MNARTIPRTAVTSYLKLVRLPLDRAIGLLPGNGTGTQPAARLALDRADATIRAVFAGVLGDAVLREDAQRRREAADEREHALGLRIEAEHKRAKADARLGARQEQADRRRQQANQRAKSEREQAKKTREEKTSRAASTERKRLDASGKAAAKVESAVEDRGRRERLEALDAKTDALAEKEKQLTAADEAKRLGDAAARAKQERKSD